MCRNLMLKLYVRKLVHYFKFSFKQFFKLFVHETGKNPVSCIIKGFTGNYPVNRGLSFISNRNVLMTAGRKGPGNAIIILYIAYLCRLI